MNFNFLNDKFFNWGKILVSLILISVLIYIVDWSRVYFSLHDANFIYIIFALIIEFSSLWIAAIRWSLCIKHLGSNLKLSVAYKGYLIGLFYNIFLPGAIGGDIVRIGFACRHGAGRPLGVTISVIIERSLGLLATLMIGWFGLLIIGSKINLAKFQIIIPIICIIALIAIIAFIFLGPYLIVKIKKKFPNIPILKPLYNNFIFLSTFKKSSILLLFFLSILFVFFNIFSFFIWANAIRINKPFSIFLFVMPITAIVTVLPVSIGGLGVRESTLSFLLFKFGVLLDQSILFAFILYFNKICLGIPGGLLQLIGYKTKNYLHNILQNNRFKRFITK